MAYDIPRTTLGRTGLTVTQLGIGGAYCDSVDGYRAALDCGVNYVDTARGYRDGEDEKVIGQAIRGRRDGLIVATKTGKRDAEGARSELETSLGLLGTDYVDIWQLHCVSNQSDLDQAFGPGGAMEAARNAREEGLIRFIGVTGHDWPLVQQAVATGLFDTVLCWYNCAMKEPEETVFPAADAHDVGVVIMNAGRNDKLFSEPDAPQPEGFYRYVLSHETVDLTVMGLRDIARFSRIASALSESAVLSEGEKIELEKYGSGMRTAGKLG